MQHQHLGHYTRPRISDHALVTQTLDGDMDAFEALVQHYSERLLSFIGSLLRPSGYGDSCEDVLQHVLLQLYRALPTLSTEVPLRPWLFRVAHNRCIDELRKQRRQQHVSFSEVERLVASEDGNALALLLDPDPLPEDLAEQHETEQQMRAIIGTLSPTVREVVWLRAVHQLSFVEIAAHLTIPAATAKTYFHRARPLLQTLLTSKEDMVKYC